VVELIELANSNPRHYVHQTSARERARDQKMDPNQVANLV
jgi:hypothetical protein